MDITPKAQFGISGNVELYSFPADKFPTYQSITSLSPEDKEKYLIDKGYNMTVNYGLDFVKNLLIASTTGSLLYTGVGSGTTPVTSADTDLETAIGARLSIQTVYSGGTGIAKFDSFYSAGDNNGAWGEAIISPSVSGANAFARKLLTSVYTKSTSVTAVLSWTITVTVT